MASRLSLYLPAFAADYSGAASVLFDLDALVVIADASCCTRNYVDYDEPRWSRDKATTLCATLRTMEVVLGEESKTIARVLEAARELQPRLIALLGSPVPAITGMDVKGMAAEIEAACGIPAIGIPTTGFATYEHGEGLALAALAKRFTKKAGQAIEPNASDNVRVAVWGLTPLDFADLGAGAAMRETLQAQGFDVTATIAMDYTLADLARAACADVNLAVSSGALRAVRQLERQQGIPYVVGVPLAGSQESLVLDALRTAAETGKSAFAFAPAPEAAELNKNASEPLAMSVSPSTPDADVLRLNGNTATPTLIVADWVQAASDRSALRLTGHNGPITIGSFFGKAPAFAEPGDVRFESEADFARWLRAHPGARVIGDPLLARLPQLDAEHLTPCPHPALSGHFER